MPRILFIAAHRPNRSPSQRYRFEQYFSALKEAGFHCELSYIIDEMADTVFYSPGKTLKKILITLKSAVKRLKDLRNASHYDIVFVQREAFMTGSSWFERKLASGRPKLVFDFDDSIWLLDTSSANKRWEWLKSSLKTKEIIAVADLVFAGNPYLAEYAMQFNRNVKIIPTTIDTDRFRRKTPYIDSETVCIGWSGSITTIKHFDEALPVLTRIKQKYGNKVRFSLMGDPEYSNESLDIKGIAWSDATEVDVISSFDIGIMPLPDDEWVKGKCGLKGLSYMALEIPTVMSALGVNTSIIKDGENGFLAATEEEWFHKLSNLIDSFALRKKLGANGRLTVENRYSVNANKKLYIDSFNELLKK
jgi:glycosyltransferase involved in cell wall biosynthesis